MKPSDKSQFEIHRMFHESKFNGNKQGIVSIEWKNDRTGLRDVDLHYSFGPFTSPEPKDVSLLADIEFLVENQWTPVYVSRKGDEYAKVLVGVIKMMSLEEVMDSK